MALCYGESMLYSDSEETTVDLIIAVLGGLVVLGVIVGVPAYFILGGSAGRSWKGIKDNEQWQREQAEKKRRGD